MTTFNNGSFSFNPASNTSTNIIKQGLQQTAQAQNAEQVQQFAQFNLHRFANPADKLEQKNRINDSINKFSRSPLSDEILNLDPQLANNETFVNAWIDQPLDFMDEQI
jgi:hypothetical protein